MFIVVGLIFPMTLLQTLVGVWRKQGSVIFIVAGPASPFFTDPVGVNSIYSHLHRNTFIAQNR